jgi:hypothetical protein
MKQRFDQVDASGSHTGPRAEAETPSPQLNGHPGQTVATPAPTSGAWLSDALKHWCTDPHAPH